MWHGRSENLADGQRAFRHRARCDYAAALGMYTNAMERDAPFPWTARATGTGETGWHTQQ